MPTRVPVAPDTAQTAGTKGSEAATTKGPTTTQDPAAFNIGTLKSAQVPSAPSSSSSYTETPMQAPAPCTTATPTPTRLPVTPDTAETAGTKGSEQSVTKGGSTTQRPAVCTTGTLKSTKVPSVPSSSSSYAETPILVPDDDGQDSYTPWITIDNASPDDPQSKLTLNHEHREGILKPNYWLHDTEIQAGQVMLKKQFPFVDGLHCPSIKGVLVIPASSEFIQILNAGRHWVCMSTIGCSAGTVQVFDNLYNRPNDVLIDHGCRMLLSPQDAVTFFNVKVQKQIGGSDCGLFALAFATDLCFGLDPHNQKYKQNETHQHFIRCLESGKITPFPKTDRRVQTHLSYNKTAIKIFCLCRLPNDKKEYVECFSCKGWYHPECASIPTWAVNSKVPWKCPKCKPQKYKKGTEKHLGAEDQQKKNGIALKRGNMILKKLTLI